MKESYLDKYEKQTLQMCVRNIKDKINSIDVESLQDKPYRGYIKEKIDSILWDAKVIENMTHIEDEEDGNEIL